MSALNSLELPQSLGDTGAYIEDYAARRLTQIPKSAAIAWLADVAPGHAFLRNWDNKCFAVVEADYPARALVNIDGTFYVYGE